MPRPKAVPKRKPFPIQRKNESWRDFSNRERAWWAEDRRISALELGEYAKRQKIEPDIPFDEETIKRMREDDQRWRQQMKERDEERTRLKEDELKQKAEEEQKRKRELDAMRESYRATQIVQEQEDRRREEARREKEERADNYARDREKWFYDRAMNYGEWNQYFSRDDYKPDDEPFR